MVSTTLNIGDFVIYEPVTALTDYMTTVLGVYFYIRTKKISKDPVIKNWSLFFLLFGASTFLGGTCHGFFEIHEGIAYKSIWLTMQVVNGLAIYFAQQATLNSVLRDSKYFAKWKLSFPIQLIVYVVTLLIFQKYVVTIIENAIAFIPIMILHLRSKDYYLKKIGQGVVISFIPAIVFLTKFSIHDYFNHIDLAHVFLMVALYSMYLGVKRDAIS